MDTTKPQNLTQARADGANAFAAAKAFAAILLKGQKLTHKTVSDTMTFLHGGTDAEDAWSWRSAYDAMEGAMVLTCQKLSQEIERLEDEPRATVTLLSKIGQLVLTQTRREAETVDLDQFSTPLALALCAALAGQVRKGDKMIEPSAGHGLLAAIPDLLGAEVSLNELSRTREALLRRLFPGRPVTPYDALQLADRLDSSGSFDVALTNPPFRNLEEHLTATFKTLADNGWLIAIVPQTFLTKTGLETFSNTYNHIATLTTPQTGFAKMGTSVATAIIVFDRTTPTGLKDVTNCETLEDLAQACATLPARENAKPRAFRKYTPTQPARSAISKWEKTSSNYQFLQCAKPINYEIKTSREPARSVGIFESYATAKVRIPGAHAHTCPLVESTAMASTEPPTPHYRPVLPEAFIYAGLLSEAQLETVIYAGQAHATYLPGYWTYCRETQSLNCTAGKLEDSFQFRKGFFIGDGTGVGKGRQASAIIADNAAQGRTRSLWISGSSDLLTDARRDWCDLGGAEADIVLQSTWKTSQEITLEAGTLFTTYATLRQRATRGNPSRLDQIVTWLGKDFDGVILFDESHAAGGAGAEKTIRGTTKGSQQGAAVIALQNHLPNARIVYLSATGAESAKNLVYTTRLGLWGGPGAPFEDRAQFLEAVNEGGIAFLELVARELKAQGLFTARSLSAEGVELESLIHPLSDADIALYNLWARKYQIIHANLKAALEATGHYNKNGKAISGAAIGAAISAFEGSKQRFFLHLINSLKAPTLLRQITDDQEAGLATVVQLISTNEAVLDRRLAETDPAEWSDIRIDLTPRDGVISFLQHAFPVHAMVETKIGEKETILELARDNHGNPIICQEAVAMRDEMILDLRCTPSTPGLLDLILQTYGPEKVAEITGRTRRVTPKDGRLKVETRGQTAAQTETSDFMSGKKSILVFSSAGGTGRSYHAEKGCGSQNARRRHIIGEAGWRASTAVQGLGRTNRNNQVTAPILTTLTTDIKAEKRFTSTIARRLDSMGALTVGERKGAGSGIYKAEDNLESKWADYALKTFFGKIARGEATSTTLEDFETKSGLAITDETGDRVDADVLPSMSRWLNRLLAFEIADQNAIFSEFEEIHAAVIETARQLGELDDGIETIRPKDLKVISDEIIRVDAVTRAPTHLVNFHYNKHNNTISLDAAMRSLERMNHDGFELAINTKTGIPALVEYGYTVMSQDWKETLEAVYIMRPTGSSRLNIKAYKETAFSPADQAAWARAWEKACNDTPKWLTSELILVTGLVLPIWKMLVSNGTMVRRVVSDTGETWLGRVLTPRQAEKLREQLGIKATKRTPETPEKALSAIEAGQVLLLPQGIKILTRRVMGDTRFEIEGAEQYRRDFTSLGCIMEIIASTPRLFIPVGRVDILSLILNKYGYGEIIPR